jgi:DNA-binding transcriptional ArsR family regulator
MEVFDAIAPPKRREILGLLSAGVLSAGEVVSHFAITQPAIPQHLTSPQHLRVLEDFGLVNERRDGTRRLLSVRTERRTDLHDFLSRGATHQFAAP